MYGHRYINLSTMLNGNDCGKEKTLPDLRYCRANLMNRSAGNNRATSDLICFKLMKSCWRGRGAGP